MFRPVKDSGVDHDTCRLFLSRRRKVMDSVPVFGFLLPVNPIAFVCVALGISIVALFSYTKFGESTVKAEEDDFIAQLLPRYLATHEEYSRALLGYMISMVGILCAMSAIGPRLLDAVAPALLIY